MKTIPLGGLLLPLWDSLTYESSQPTKEWTMVEIKKAIGSDQIRISANAVMHYKKGDWEMTLKMAVREAGFVSSTPTTFLKRRAQRVVFLTTGWDNKKRYEQRLYCEDARYFYLFSCLALETLRAPANELLSRFLAAVAERHRV